MDIGRQMDGWFEVMPNTEQAQEWTMYFDRLGWQPVTFKRLSEGKSWTAPCEVPQWLEHKIAWKPKQHERTRDGSPLPADPHGDATYSALCERYGVSVIPGGWDAVDMAQAFAKHGAGLRQHIEDVVAHGPTTKSLFARIVDRLRLSSTDDELRAHYSHVDAAAE